MPRQNRVSPFSEIIRDAERGLFMGNRGILHDADGELTTARWRHPHWIICRTEFRGRRRAVMSPGRYTELFFSDEAAALAAGHRPCAECRRAAYNDFCRAWSAGQGATGLIRAAEIDRALHAQRVVARSRRQITFRAELASLPDGAFFASPDAADVAVLKSGGRLWAWRFGGYTPLAGLAPDSRVEVLTPRGTVAALAAGYRPELHPDAAPQNALAKPIAAVPSS